MNFLAALQIYSSTVLRPANRVETFKIPIQIDNAPTSSPCHLQMILMLFYIKRMIYYGIGSIENDKPV